MFLSPSIVTYDKKGLPEQEDISVLPSWTSSSCSIFTKESLPYYWNRFKILWSHRYHKPFQTFISYIWCTCQLWYTTLKILLPAVQWKAHCKRTENVSRSLTHMKIYSLITSGPWNMILIAELLQLIIWVNYLNKISATKIVPQKPSSAHMLRKAQLAITFCNQSWSARDFSSVLSH